MFNFICFASEHFDRCFLVLKLKFCSTSLTGNTPYGTQLLEFTSFSMFDSAMCNETQQPSCIAIVTDILDWDLHGDHIYYISIRVTNAAGLSVTATSEPYRHVIDLPSAGVVLDTVDPDKANNVFWVRVCICSEKKDSHMYGMLCVHYIPFTFVKEEFIILTSTPGLEPKLTHHN